MADYDPTSIPILDDVIEKIDDEAKLKNEENADSPDTDAVTDKNLELFTAEPVVTIDDEIEEDIEEEQEGSALIGFDANDNQISTEDPETYTVQTPDNSLNIEQLTDEIVSNIMPELELQLRTMVRKALTDKLDTPSSGS